MKYYVMATKHYQETYDRVIYGDNIKRRRRSYTIISNDILNDKFVEDEVTIKKIYDNPIKTLRSANILLNKLKKDDNNKQWDIIVKEYPDEISYDQFSAFIRW